MENFSMAARAAGFLFWLAVAFFLYRGDRAGAAWLGLLAAAAASVYGLARYLQRGARARGARRPRAEPPSSDLPEFDFSNVKPKDFE